MINSNNCAMSSSSQTYQTNSLDVTMNSDAPSTFNADSEVSYSETEVEYDSTENTDEDDLIFKHAYATNVSIEKVTDKLHELMDKSVSYSVLEEMVKILDELSISHKHELFDLGILNRICGLFDNYYKKIAGTRYIGKSCDGKPNDEAKPGLFTQFFGMFNGSAKKKSENGLTFTSIVKAPLNTEDENLAQLAKIIKLFLFGSGPKQYQDSLTKHCPGIVDQMAESEFYNFLETEFKNNNAFDINRRLDLYKSLVETTECFALCPEFSKYLLRMNDSRSIASIFTEFAATLNNHLISAIDKNSLDTELVAFIHQSDELVLKLRKLAIESESLPPVKKSKQTASVTSMSKEEKERLYAETLRLYQIQPCNLGEYRHSFLREKSDPHSSSATPRTTRIGKEIAAMQHSLPLCTGGSIFLCTDESRVDILKALISGPVETPYANGLFEFDIYFPESYPNNPPKCSIVTTDGGRVRFNPNLYRCGKVCLSILGTWQGTPDEQWSPMRTLLQVLVSIQSLVMNKEPLCNEPGYQERANTPESYAYNMKVEYANLVYAIHQQWKNPPKYFEKIAKRHFWLKREEIIEQAKNWLERFEQANSEGGLKCSYEVFEGSAKYQKDDWKVNKLIEDFRNMEEIE